MKIEDLYSNFFENTTDLFLLYNGFIVEDLVAGTDFIKFMPVDKIKGKSIVDTLPKDISQLIIESLAEVRETKKGKTIGFSIEKMGKTFYHEEKFLYLKDNRVIGIIQDVTTIKEQELALQKYTNELAITNESLSNIIYHLSHQLKEPIRTITSFAELSKTAESFDEVGIYADFISNSGERLLKILKKLQYYEGNFDKGVNTKSSCKEIIDGIIRKITPKINDTNFYITVQPFSEELKASPFYVDEVLYQLLSNAIKFRDISKEKSTIDIKIENNNDALLFTVKDNGIGIPVSNQQRIFEMFVRANANENGAGIGLSSCKRYLSHIGGKIWVESTVGEGSIFYFTIPHR